MPHRQPCVTLFDLRRQLRSSGELVDVRAVLDPDLLKRRRGLPRSRARRWRPPPRARQARQQHRVLSLNRPILQLIVARRAMPHYSLDDRRIEIVTIVAKVGVCVGPASCPATIPEFVVDPWRQQRRTDPGA